MELQDKSGNLLLEKVDALVIPVNCVGVIGKGIFQSIKTTFPENYIEYTKACRGRLLAPSTIFPVRLSNSELPSYILNLPTKDHWKERTSLETLEQGFLSLRSFILENGIRSIALAPLTTNLDSISKKDIKNLLSKVMREVPDLRIMNYKKITQEEELKNTQQIDLDNESILPKLSLSNSNDFFEEGKITYEALEEKERKVLSKTYQNFFSEEGYKSKEIPLSEKEKVLQAFYNDYSAINRFKDYLQNERNSQSSSPFVAELELERLKNFYLNDVKLARTLELASYSKKELDSRIFPKSKVEGSPFLNGSNSQTQSLLDANLRENTLESYLTKNSFLLALDSFSFQPNSGDNQTSRFIFDQRYDLYQVEVIDEEVLNRLKLKNSYEIEKYLKEHQVNESYNITLSIRDYVRTLRENTNLANSEVHQAYAEDLTSLAGKFEEFFRHKYNNESISNITEEEIKSNLFDINLRLDAISRDLVNLAKYPAVLERELGRDLDLDPLENNFNHLDYALRQALKSKITRLDQAYGTLPFTFQDLDLKESNQKIVVHLTNPNYLKDWAVQEEGEELTNLEFTKPLFQNERLRIYARNKDTLDIFFSLQKNALDLVSHSQQKLLDTQEEESVREAAKELRQVLKGKNIQTVLLGNDSFSLDRSLYFPYRGKTFQNEAFKILAVKEILTVLKNSLEREEALEEGSLSPIDLNVIRNLSLDRNKQSLSLVKLAQLENNIFACDQNTKELVKVLNPREYLYIHEHSPFYLLHLIKENEQDLSSVGSRENNAKFIANNLPEVDLNLEVEKAGRILEMRINQEGTAELRDNYEDFREKTEDKTSLLLYRANDGLGNVLSTQLYGLDEPKALVNKNLVKFYKKLKDVDVLSKESLNHFRQSFQLDEANLDKLWLFEDQEGQTVPELLKNYKDLQEKRTSYYEELENTKQESVKRRLEFNIDSLNTQLNRTLDTLAYFENAQIVFLARQRIADLYKFKQDVSAAIYNDDEESKAQAVDLGFAVYQGGYKGSDNQILSLVFDNYKDFNFYQKTEISDLEIDERMIDDYNKKLANLYFDNADGAIEILKKVEEKFSDKNAAKLYRKFQPDFFDYANRLRNSLGLDSSLLADRLDLTNFLATGSLSTEEKELLKLNPEVVKELERVNKLYSEALTQDVLEQIYPKSSNYQNSDNFPIIPKTLQRYSEGTKSIESFKENNAVASGLLFKQLNSVQNALDALETEKVSLRPEDYLVQRNSLLFQKELLVSIGTEAFKRSNFSKPVWDKLVSDPSFQQRYLDKNFSNTFQKSVQNLFLSKFHLEKSKLIQKRSEVFGKYFLDNAYKDFSRFDQAKLLNLSPEEERLVKKNRSQFFEPFIQSSLKQTIDLKTHSVLEKNLKYSKFFEEDLTDKEQEAIKKYVESYKRIAEEIDQAVELDAIKNSVLPLLDYNNKFFVSENLDTKTLSNQYLLTQSMVNYSNLLDRSTEIREYPYLISNKAGTQSFSRRFKFAYDTQDREKVDKLLSDNFLSFKEVIELYKIKSIKVQEEYLKEIEEKDRLIQSFKELEAFTTKEELLKDKEKLRLTLNPIVNYFRKEAEFFLDDSKDSFDSFVNLYSKHLNNDQESLKQTKLHLKRRLLEAMNHFLDLDEASKVEGKIELGEKELSLPSRVRIDYFVDFTKYLYANHFQEKIQKEKEELTTKLTNLGKGKGFFHRLEAIGDKILKERSNVASENLSSDNRFNSEAEELLAFQESFLDSDLNNFSDEFYEESLEEFPDAGITDETNPSEVLSTSQNDESKGGLAKETSTETVLETKLEAGALENSTDYLDFGFKNEVIQPVLASYIEYKKAKTLRKTVLEFTKDYVKEKEYHQGVQDFLNNLSQDKTLDSKSLSSEERKRLKTEAALAFFESSGYSNRELKRFVYRDKLYTKQMLLKDYLEFLRDNSPNEEGINRRKLLGVLLKNLRSFKNIEKIVEEQEKMLFAKYLSTWEASERQEQQKEWMNLAHEILPLSKKEQLSKIGEKLESSDFLRGRFDNLTKENEALLKEKILNEALKDIFATATHQAMLERVKSIAKFSYKEDIAEKETRELIEEGLKNKRSTFGKIMDITDPERVFSVKLSQIAAFKDIPEEKLLKWCKKLEKFEQKENKFFESFFYEHTPEKKANQSFSLMAMSLKSLKEKEDFLIPKHSRALKDFKQSLNEINSTQVSLDSRNRVTFHLEDNNHPFSTLENPYVKKNRKFYSRVVEPKNSVLSYNMEVGYQLNLNSISDLINTKSTLNSKEVKTAIQEVKEARERIEKQESLKQGLQVIDSDKLKKIFKESMEEVELKEPKPYITNTEKVETAKTLTRETLKEGASFYHKTLGVGIITKVDSKNEDIKFSAKFEGNKIYGFTKKVEDTPEVDKPKVNQSLEEVSLSKSQSKIEEIALQKPTSASKDTELEEIDLAKSKKIIRPLQPSKPARNFSM